MNVCYVCRTVIWRRGSAAAHCSSIQALPTDSQYYLLRHICGTNLGPRLDDCESAYAIMTFGTLRFDLTHTFACHSLG